MALRQQKVIFARINRRRPDQRELVMRTFRDDMTELATSRLTRYVERRSHDVLDRTWIAADMEIEPDGDFMSGTLGFTTKEERRVFEDQSWSWIKAQTENTEAARPDAVAPFAIDLREDHRWLAFAPAPHLPAKTFMHGFRLVLVHAVAEANLVPADWEVDLVVSRDSITRWLEIHPAVHFIRRTVKFPNPGRDIDDDRSQMRALNARRKTEEFKASNRRVLDIRSEAFQGKLDGTETGDLEIYLLARGAPGTGNAVFQSNNAPDQRTVDIFGKDLIRGIDVVLGALRGYVLEKDPAARPGSIF
jgi:hypothetical protein